jgi:glc operon protein GlcG
MNERQAIDSSSFIVRGVRRSPLMGVQMKRITLKALLVIVIAAATVSSQSSAGRLVNKLSSKTTLNLAVAKEIVAAAEAEARKNSWNVSIAIVDDAGRLLYFQRMDETTNASVEVAIGKAVHSANYRRDTKFHEDLLSKGNDVVLALPNSMPIEGGLRLLSEGKVIGGIGVSGVQSEQDGQIAKAGADLLGK